MTIPGLAGHAIKGGGGLECPTCYQIPEMYFGQWVPHKPGECPVACKPNGACCP